MTPTIIKFPTRATQNPAPQDRGIALAETLGFVTGRVVGGMVNDAAERRIEELAREMKAITELGEQTPPA